MNRPCSLCKTEISAARLKAVPETQLCIGCKATHDEPPLKGTARYLSKSLVESSVWDLEELQAAAGELGGIE
jgi:hypothetical protein